MACPRAQNSPEPLLFQASKRYNHNLNLIYFEFLCLFVMICVYMIQIITSMQFLLCLEMLAIIGDEFEFHQRCCNQVSLKLSLFI